MKQIVVIGNAAELTLGTVGDLYEFDGKGGVGRTFEKWPSH